MSRRIAILAALGLVVVGAPGAVAATPPAAVNLSPARFPGTLRPHVVIGPMTLSNGTADHYGVRVFPTLLGQRRDGGIFVRDDADSLRFAARYLAASVLRFDFPPRGSRTVLGRLRRVPPDHSIYGGILFRATPSEKQGQITNVLQLNASVLLDPQARYQRIRFVAADPIRAETLAGRRLRLLIPVRNDGNVYKNIAGRFEIADTAGKRLLAQDLKPIRILPGAIVDMPGIVTTILQRGTYTITARLHAGRQRLVLTGAIRLFGPNEVASRDAKIAAFPSPAAHPGEKVDVKATVRNTGNVDFAPAARLEIRPVIHGEVAARPAQRVPMRLDSIAAGKSKDATVSVELPGKATAYQLTVRIYDGSRELDDATVSVTPTKKPGLWQRFRAWIQDHAVLLVLLLLLAVVIVAVAAARWARRRDPAPAAAAVTQPGAPAGTVDLNTASVEQLAAVPGVGPAAARRIVEHRDEYGRFASVDDLRRVEQFDRERVEALREHLRV